MSRWFRHYAGMMRDDKLVSAAIRSKQTVERVVWVWGAILESAAEIDDEGRFELDPAEVAYFLRADISDVDAILDALEMAGRTREGSVAKWGARQFQSDRSAERQRRYRDNQRKRQADGDEGGGDGEVTSPPRHGDAPETETEEDTEIPPRKPPRKRGGGDGKTRIPDDWEPTPIAELTPKARACAERWTRASYETVAEAFACYWRRTGKMNKDWRLTWCEWVIKEHAKVMRDQKFGNAPTEPKVAVARTPEDLEDRARWFANIGNDDEAARFRKEAERLRGQPPPEIASIIGRVSGSLRAGRG